MYAFIKLMLNLLTHAKQNYFIFIYFNVFSHGCMYMYIYYIHVRECIYTYVMRVFISNVIHND